MGLCRSMGTPVHLRKALEGLALDPALPEDLSRRLIAHCEAPAELGTRPDLTPELIDEMIADGRLRMPRSRASNDGLPGQAPPRGTSRRLRAGGPGRVTRGVRTAADRSRTGVGL